MADTSDGGAEAHLQSGPEEAGPAHMNGEPRPGWSVLSLSRENGHGPPVDLEQGRPKLKPQVSSLSRVDVPITVKFRDVRYEVTLRPHEPWFQRLSLKKTAETLTTVRKEILHGINGAVLPGEMLAMLGPSGSGKTTLLNVLGGRLHHGVSGGILYNDLAYQKSMKRQMGFVTQDDVLYATLTVRETLQYAALLRLPKELTRAQKLARADEIMLELGIDKCKDTIIGGPFMRGISGGERKRVSIGHELLINPSLMLLDEPTSGLDSTTALRILTTLDELAQGGRTVITTIHQPSSKMFLMFDKLLLLADGSTLYYGAASDAMAYFAQRGYTPKYATNPADYLLDLATGEVADGPENAQAVKEELTTAYGQTRGPLELQRLNSLPMASAEDQAKSVGKKTWPTSWLEQFALLTLRGIKERRFEALGGLRFIQIVAISVVCGCLWFNSKQRTAADIADQTGILFFESTFWGFFPLFTALFTFPQERQMLNKERGVGMYRLTAYFFARTVGDMPLELIMPFVFTIIVYWMADLKHSFVAYILHLLTLLLAVLVSQSLGLLVGATVMDLKKATTLASVIMLAFLLTGGYFVRQIPVWIRWLKYLSFPYYTFRLLLKIQYDTDALYECPGETPSGLCLIQNAPALHGVPLGGGGIEVMALFIMLVGYRFFAYAALRTLNKGTK